MTYLRVGGEMRTINLERTPNCIPRKPRTVTVTKQYCCPESDERIRAMIRGMDDRERKIALDEVLRLYRREVN